MVRLTSSTDAYASVRVAVYEPTILHWLSVPTLTDMLTDLLDRALERRVGDVPGGLAAPTIMRFDGRIARGQLTSALRAATLAAATKLDPSPHAFVSTSARKTAPSDAERKRRAELVRGLVVDAQLDLDHLLDAIDDGGLPHLVGKGGLAQALSPIGLMHLYRQLYFDAGSGLGPFEHAFTVAPKEELVIIQEMTRRESVERTEALSRETTLEKSAEESTLEELSDFVATALLRDMQIGVAAAAEGNFGVVSGSAASTFDLAESTERSREVATTRSVSVVKRSSEVLRKSYSLTVKSFTELSERSTVKRTVKNETAVPVSYGLRRVLRKIRVKVQSLGPRMVWQFYVKRPGDQLALSKLVMFRESDPIAPSSFPDAPPKPVGGTEAGTQTLAVFHANGIGHIEVVIPADSSRRYTGLTIDSIADADPGEDSRPPGLLEASAAGDEDVDARVWRYKFKLDGEAQIVNLTYTLSFEPSTVVLDEWRTQVLAAQQSWEVGQREAAFERAKRIILAKSQVRPRPTADLRDEERYEILSRLIAEAFPGAPASSLPAPVEVELFHRYFELAGLFYYVHPAWWLPRYGSRRTDYEITEDSEPARFGKSLGWLIQLDGDRRRDEFLNSPWVRACLPIRPGAERDALAWLARHIEGSHGFSTAVGSPVGNLLDGIEARRAAERIAAPGPDYVTLDGEIAPSRTDAATAYPVVEEFDVVVPTDGFVYDEIEVG